VDTLSNDFINQIQTSKPNDILESILMQLQTELAKSKRVQEELSSIKDSVNELDKSVEQDNKHVRYYIKKRREREKELN
jgi:conjugal transfer/entry exclusion protein